jgi:hypothetical protein
MAVTAAPWPAPQPWRFWPQASSCGGACQVTLPVTRLMAVMPPCTSAWKALVPV